MKIEKRLKELGIELPVTPKPVANYLPFKVSGNLIYLAGSICMMNGEMKFTGAVGEDCDEAMGYLAAQCCAYNQISILKDALGDLDRVEQMVSLSGFVWANYGFQNAPKVINGASDTMVNVFGDRGKHSRTAVSVSGLPLGSTVEIQSVWEISM